MREILFRGIDKSTCKWIYGDLLQRDFNKTIKAIMPPFPNTKSFVVKDYTVGQYTGLTDKNGKKIFEGDIVDVEYDINYVGVAAERIGKFKVIFSDGCFMKEKISGSGLFHFISSDVTTILGNVYDNPELLDGDKE